MFFHNSLWRLPCLGSGSTHSTVATGFASWESSSSTCEGDKLQLAAGRTSSTSGAGLRLELILLLFLKALQTLKLWSHQVIQKSWLSAALGRCLVGSCLQGQEPAWTEKPQRSPYFLFATDSKGLFVAHVQITPEVAVLSKSWRVSGRARTIIRRCLRCLRVLRRNTGRWLPKRSWSNLNQLALD